MMTAETGRRRIPTAIQSAAAAIFIWGLLASCGPINLQRAIDLVRPALATLEGTVDGYSPDPQPIVIALWSAEEPGRGALRFAFVRGGGAFRFVVPAPGRYQVMAFEDLDGDYAFRSGEPAGICREPIMAQPGATVSGISIRIEAPDTVRIPLKVEVQPTTLTAAVPELNYYSIGQVTTIDDARFSQTNAQAGLWMPIEVIRDAGMGLYFLEPFAPDKIPLLFVHGSGANPTDFRALIERVDRTRYQPWVFFYPTGMRLERQSQLLYRIIATLQDQLEFRRLCLVSHSMGGLVARGFLAEAARNRLPLQVPVFVSLSAPWQGHAFAGKGVKRSAAMLPAWRDMAPTSPFLQAIWEPPLAPETRFMLIFGYSGGFSLTVDRNNDGAVSLASQLDPRAQTAAHRVLGFDEDHSSILTAPGVIETVNALLNGEPPPAWVERKTESKSE